MIREQDFKINWLGAKITKPDELLATIREGLASDGPTIIDAAVASDEVPNLPHLDLALVGRVAQAKVREALLAITCAWRQLNRDQLNAAMAHPVDLDEALKVEAI